MSLAPGLLMMVTRSNAVSQVVGFMSLENGLILAATGALVEVIHNEPDGVNINPNDPNARQNLDYALSQKASR